MLWLMVATQDMALRIEGLVKDYPGVRAVDGATVEVVRGEIHGLVGENGAGKSTLIKMISGVVRPDSGTMFVNGTPISFTSARDAYKAGISALHQELSLVPYLDATENIFLGRPYPTTRFRLIDWFSLRHAAKQIADLLDVDIPLDVPVGELSPATQTMIAIARAISVQATVLILDEPTASLSDQEIRRLFRVLHVLKQRGTSILYVSHRLEEIFEIADRITVMRDGRVVSTLPASQTSVDDLIRLMIGRSLSQVFPKRTRAPGRPLLEVAHLTSSKVSDISFVLHRGEILGIGGLAGSGRSEVLRLLFGAERRGGGTVTLDGKSVALQSPGHALRAGIAMVPEERRSQGLVLSQSVVENLTLAHLRSFALADIFLRPSHEALVAKGLVDRLRIKTADVGQNVAQLSGGNQQKVVMGKCLAGQVIVLLLDEPTRGVDVGTKFEIYQTIRGIADSGSGVLLVSSDLPELIGLSDRILVLHDGHLVVTVEADQLDQEELLRLCYGRPPA